MANFKIFNIGKANARIDELENELAALKASAPTNQATELAEALSSNESIAVSLTEASASIVTLKASVSDLSAKLEKAQNEVNASATQLTNTQAALDKAVSTFKIDLKADATSVEKVAALEGAAVTVLARQGINSESVPSPDGGHGKSQSFADGVLAHVKAMKGK